MSDAPGLEPLRRLHPDLYVAARPLPLWIGDVGTRMTVIRLGRDLLLHSPVALDDTLAGELEPLGRVRWVLGPSLVHHFFLPDYARAYPDAELCAAPGLPEKKPALSFQHVIGAGPAPWGDGVLHHVLGGAPRLNEVVLFHPASRTLVLTDLAFHVRSGPGNRARLFHRLMGATDRFGPHRLLRLFIRDRQAARRSLEHILAWDFDRVVVTHGEVLETGGPAALRRGFDWLLA